MKELIKELLEFIKENKKYYFIPILLLSLLTLALIIVSGLVVETGFVYPLF